MRIIPILSTNKNDNTAFNGRVIAKGNNWPVTLKKAFEESPAFNNIAKDLDKDICGRISRVIYKKSTIFRHKGDKTYRISLSLEKSNPTVWEKFLSVISRPFNKTLTNHYHSEYSTMDILQVNMSEKFIKKRMGIE